jgi:hypothetical protein
VIYGVCRTPEEFSAGHASGAINIPYMYRVGSGSFHPSLTLAANLFMVKISCPAKEWIKFAVLWYLFCIFFLLKSNSSSVILFVNIYI